MKQKYQQRDKMSKKKPKEILAEKYNYWNANVLDSCKSRSGARRKKNQ